MKNLITVIVLLLSSLQSIGQENQADIDPMAITPKDSNNAVIIIYRGGQFGGALENYSLLVDGNNICQLSNARYLYVEIPKGKHNISAFIGIVQLLQKVTNFELEVEPGEIYFISTTIKTSFLSKRLDLSEVTKNTAKRDLEKCSIDNCQKRISIEKE